VTSEYEVWDENSGEWKDFRGDWEKDVIDKFNIPYARKKTTGTMYIYHKVGESKTWSSTSIPPPPPYKQTLLFDEAQ